jgi:cytochrome c oxidase subunit 3
MAGSYYVPASSKWPIIGSLGLGFFMFGAAGLIHHSSFGLPVFLIGMLTLMYMVFGWFGNVIHESLSGLYDHRMDHSFRWGMAWFIFSEVFFFIAFFGALFYTRHFAVHWLGGEGAKGISGQMLWPNFKAIWPVLHNPDPNWIAPKEVMPAFGIPALNTLLLLSSGVTITWSHWGLRKNNRAQLILGLIATVALGATFLFFQGYEYMHAYHELGLTLASGIYGTTFFMLTGFHGMHVTLGAIMLTVITIRAMRGHFTPEHHFAFEAVSWYWHFVDVVWLALFVLVYWL